MERRLEKKIPYRLPKIPRPRHKVKGYRYLEEDNSDESDSEKSDIEAVDEDRVSEEEKDSEVGSNGSQSPGPGRNRFNGRRKRCDDAAYEQAGEGGEYARAV